MSNHIQKRELIIKQAWCYLGKPYIWGGDDPIRGFDCSGFIIELLKSIGEITEDQDYTAHDLYNLYIGSVIDNPYEGCLVFWKNSNNRIIHVELCLTDTESIGASGGGPTSKTEKDAIAQNAFIKVRPIYSKTVVEGFVDVCK